MASQLPHPEFYQLPGHGGWTWCVKGHNGEPFVSAHEPDGFASKDNAERNFAMVFDYFVGLHAQKVLLAAADRFTEKPTGDGAEVMTV